MEGGGGGAAKLLEFRVKGALEKNGETGAIA